MIRRSARTLVVRGCHVSYVGTRYGVLVNTKATLGYSTHQLGWRGSRKVAKLGPVAVFRRTDGRASRVTRR